METTALLGHLRRRMDAYSRDAIASERWEQRASLVLLALLWATIALLA